MNRNDALIARLQPVIIGADILAYSYVREFHRAYGIDRCIILATKNVKMLSKSRFTDYRLIPGQAIGNRICEALESLADEMHDAGDDPILLVLGCDDHHARVLSENKAHLESLGYVVPYIDFPLLDEITQKRRFYEICEELDIPYPATRYFSAADGPHELPVDEFTYPLILKPSNSAQFQDATVKGWRKIYEIDSPEELQEVWHNIRTSDYANDIAIQDFIPGDDAAIRTLTTFSDAAGQLRVVSGGCVCLQDHNPTALGNPVCIIGEAEPRIIECAQRFLAHTGYRGFANFDIKFDERDGSFRFFEVNTRCGRNTYYMSLGGANFVSLIVREFIFHEAIERTNAYRPFVYCCVPPYVLKRSVSDAGRLKQALRLLKTTPDPNPLSYAPDSLAHKLWSRVMYWNHIRKFKRFYWDTGGKQLK